MDIDTSPAAAGEPTGPGAAIPSEGPPGGAAPTGTTSDDAGGGDLVGAPPRRRASRRTALTPQDWVEAATRVLVAKSIDSVNVDGLARTLKVTRGSFYWHFSDRDHLLSALLQRWHEDATQQVISRFEEGGVTARQLIVDLVSLPFRGRAAERASSIELAIRAWARRDELARKAVDEVDARRLYYIGRCFERLGFAPAESRTRAFMLYSYQIAEALVQSGPAQGERAERRVQVESWLLAGADDLAGSAGAPPSAAQPAGARDPEA